MSRSELARHFARPARWVHCHTLGFRRVRVGRRASAAGRWVVAEVGGIRGFAGVAEAPSGVCAPEMTSGRGGARAVVIVVSGPFRGVVTGLDRPFQQCAVRKIFCSSIVSRILRAVCEKAMFQTQLSRYVSVGTSRSPYFTPRQ